jgi:bacterial/archaeal transporter family-2 protein
VDRGTAVVLTAAAGGLIALQAPINGRLASAVGNIQATFVSFVVGTLVLAGIVALAKGGYGQLGEARHVSWIYLTGGLLGAVYVTTALVAVKTLGAGGVTAATVAGQLALSLVVDQLGWLGVARQPITAGRVLGVALLAAGVYFVVRD